LAALTAVLVFRDGEPTLRRGHYEQNGMLMSTWRALNEAMDELERIASEVRGLIRVAARAAREGNPIMDDHFTELNVSTRCAMRRVWVVVEMRERLCKWLLQPRWSLRIPMITTRSAGMRM
jgi:hypothetical protein